MFSQRQYMVFFIVLFFVMLAGITFKKYSMFIFPRKDFAMQVGKKAPHFTRTAVIEKSIDTTFSLQTLEGKYKVLFFYPADFTYVCPTELHAFQDKLEDFIKRNVAVVGVSVDSVESHQKWLETPKKEGGVQGITYPLLSDVDKTMSWDYGVLDEKEGRALRGVFILDKDNIVQAALIQNMSLGRNIEEVLRVIDALQFTEKQGKVCPANWHEGDKALETTQESVKEYFAD